VKCYQVQVLIFCEWRPGAPIMSCITHDVVLLCHLVCQTSWLRGTQRTEWPIGLRVPAVYLTTPHTQRSAAKLLAKVDKKVMSSFCVTEKTRCRLVFDEVILNTLFFPSG